MAITTRLILGALNGMLAPIKVNTIHNMTSAMYNKQFDIIIYMFIITLLVCRLIQSKFAHQNTMP
jgi:hypothetical protein